MSRIYSFPSAHIVICRRHDKQNSIHPEHHEARTCRCYKDVERIQVAASYAFAAPDAVVIVPYGAGVAEVAMMDPALPFFLRRPDGIALLADAALPIMLC